MQSSTYNSHRTSLAHQPKRPRVIGRRIYPPPRCYVVSVGFQTLLLPTTVIGSLVVAEDPDDRWVKRTLTGWCRLQAPPNVHLIPLIIGVILSRRSGYPRYTAHVNRTAPFARCYWLLENRMIGEMAISGVIGSRAAVHGT